MKIILVEESTTLPEGAQISVVRARIETKKSQGPPFTELRAHKDKDQIAMRVDDIAPHNLRQYLDMMLRQIAKIKERFNAIPKERCTHYSAPKDIAEFTESMSAKGMFETMELPVA